MVRSMDIPRLETLGRRICIFGPSNAGKSTLAVALGQKLGISPVHLDALAHLPNTAFRRRPEEDFHALQGKVYARDEWIVDGNYSDLLPERLARATGFILLSDNRVSNFGRYLKRTFFEPDRLGQPQGAVERLNWDMVSWVLWRSPPSQQRLRQRLAATDLPRIDCHGMADLKRLYARWRLERAR